MYYFVEDRDHGKISGSGLLCCAKRFRGTFAILIVLVIKKQKITFEDAEHDLADLVPSTWSIYLVIHLLGIL